MRATAAYNATALRPALQLFGSNTFCEYCCVSFLAAAHPQRLGCQKGNLNNGTLPDKPTCRHTKSNINTRTYVSYACVFIYVCGGNFISGYGFCCSCVASSLVNCVAYRSCAFTTTLMKAKISCGKKLVQQQQQQ